MTNNTYAKYQNFRTQVFVSYVRK